MAHEKLKKNENRRRNANYIKKVTFKLNVIK